MLARNNVNFTDRMGSKKPHNKVTPCTISFISGDQPVWFSQDSPSFSTERPTSEKSPRSLADQDGWSPYNDAKLKKKKRHKESMVSEVRRVVRRVGGEELDCGSRGSWAPGGFVSQFGRRLHR